MKKIILQSVLMAGIVGNFSGNAVNPEYLVKNRTKPEAGSSTTIYAEYSKTVANNMTLQTEIVNYKSEIAELKKAKADSQKSLDEVVANTISIKEQWSAKETELKATKADLATAQTARDAAQGELATARGNLTAAEAARDAAQGELATARGNLTAAEAEIARLRQEVADMDAKFEEIYQNLIPKNTWN